MDADQLFKAGRLAEAVAAQTQAVKANPADHRPRLFLFELLAFAGDLDRARKQLDVLHFDEMELQTAVIQYRQILDAEQARREVFTREREPEFLVPPPDHVTVRLEALKHLRDNNTAKAAEWLEHAVGIGPTVRGRVNGGPVAELRDGDDLFGPVLEAFAQGKYYWVPLEQIESVRTNPPRFPRDLLYLPARLETPTASGEIFLPAVYPGSHADADEQVKLGRITNWSEGAGPVRGVGQHTLLVGDGAVGLLEVRELEVEPAGPTG